MTETIKKRIWVDHFVSLRVITLDKNRKRQYLFYSMLKNDTDTIK